MHRKTRSFYLTFLLVTTSFLLSSESNAQRGNHELGGWYMYFLRQISAKATLELWEMYSIVVLMLLMIFNNSFYGQVYLTSSRIPPLELSQVILFSIAEL